MFDKRIQLLVAILLFTVKTVAAQDNKVQISRLEDTLVVLADSMYSSFIPDERTVYTEKFVKKLVGALKIPGSFDYPFDRLKDKISIIYPDDRTFRVFNWLIIPSEVDMRYYGAIQMNAEQLKLFPLIDYTRELNKGAEDSILKGGHWFGAMYYRILKHEVNGQDVYTMFGKNSTSLISDKKILDPMVITATGPVFGAPIFNVLSESNPNEHIKRFVIEYKKGVQASMNWDAEMNAIYFDRLVSEQNDPNRKYTFVPSGQYDGFRWVDESWNYMKDLIPIDILKDGQAPAPTAVKGKE